ncbi:efflux RND transporter permease subunit [Magnetospirillum sp. 64-120]|uniref:efflux RND transporter permease subunit n=1 Tax=Magnetospirillum sp. 64-120 TaxID=1895778 RepID=UPI000AE8A648|nr:efflux RND transporter permease subunit [Magnetospirillum sp. 64-120]
MKLGLSGTIAKHFIKSPLTPLLLLASLAVGLIALMSLPREEEPQISVPMVDIMVSANGLKAVDAAELVTKPLEDIVKGIDAVEHVYSQTMDDQVVVTARFNVGTSEDAAILRVHEQVRANIRALPTGIPEPLIVGRGINDVAILVLTLAPKPEAAERWNDNALYNLAEELRHELVKVDNVGQSDIVGGRPDQIRVEPDPEALALYGITLNQLVNKVENANRSFMVGAVREAGRHLPVVGGQTLSGIPDIGNLLLTSHDGRPVYVKDVAKVVMGGAETEARAWHIEKGQAVPAVSLSIAKRAGANAVLVAQDTLARLDQVKGKLIPDSVTVTVTRNYGETASDKADELLFHLALATLSIVVLITWALGWREGLVVALVVPTTILLTLFASHLMGYTINRVSLFALIFSIGILVDDAIVVVENIVRRWQMDKTSDRAEVAVWAVAEVGNPTIVATLTIVAALLPMMFVSGLMGPYMSPIPANASSAMMFSFFVAVIITPWLLLKIAGRSRQGAVEHHGHADRLGEIYRRFARPLLTGRERSKKLLLGVTIATFVAMSMFGFKAVTVKLLPFDNKSEVQVVVDLPEGSTLEDTERVLMDAAKRLSDLPELTSIQAHAGTAAPFNFNGLVRHYYLRSSPEMGDLQLNLTSRHDRSRPSHAIALDVRQRLAGMAKPDGTAIRVVEVPPGPPVLSTLLAEIYGPDAETRRQTAAQVRDAFAKVDFIVDVDDTLSHPWQRLRVSIDQERLEFFGVEQQAVYDTIQALMGGVRVGYSHRGQGANPKEIVIALPKSDKHPGELLATTPVPSAKGVVELGDVVNVSYEPASAPIFRRDGRFAEMIQAELAGRYEAPIYGMFAVEDNLPENIEVKYHGQPLDETTPTLLWDGEWEITYVTFRDMGAAFGVAILGIYLLVVAQFGSFRLPLVILVPVPLTLIGIVIGHMLFAAPFTATSMIGFIALAGIIVRNSILLVDFIRHRLGEGASIRQAVLDSGATRFKPIVLTAAAAMIGAGFILADPIFQGLAISLVFGLLSSTALTLLVIPALYVWLRDDGRELED